MYQTRRICITVLLIGALLALQASAKTEIDVPVKDQSLSHLEQRLNNINSELDRLAHYSLRSGVGAIGFRSQSYDQANHLEWIEIDLDREYPIDEIVLVPTIWRDSAKGFRADCFPVAFRIMTGTATDHSETLIAEYSATDSLLPRIAPLVVPTPGTIASWVRIEATQLSPRAFDNLFVLHLSELLVFSGSENVALRQPVKTSSNMRESSGAWDKRFLVDGFMPYLMDSAQGNQSVAYASASGEQPVISLDLGTEYLLNRIHLHAVDQSDTVPQAYAGDLGMPRHLRIEGANTPDFSNAVVLLDTIRETINDTGPIMMWRIPGKTCRFVRFMAAETDIPMDPNAPTFRIGFAEIELFSHGHNVALGKSAFTNESHKRRFRTPVALTDGHNLYGRILPIRTWVEELARRHNLETERPLITAELSRRYARQKTNLTRMGWLAGLLTAGTIIMVLVDRIIKQRTIFQLRKQIAADLHDELGGNLHAISLLSDLSLAAKASPDKLDKLLHRMRALSERTGIAALHCTNMLEAEGLYEDLVRDMQKISSHLMTDLEHNISFEGEPLIQQIKPRRRIDLFLFYKECLTNILRHSSATQVAVTLVARQGHITLRVADNGQGLGASETNEVPVSLKHRARLLGAKVAAECSTNGGTCITLQLRI